MQVAPPPAQRRLLSSPGADQKLVMNVQQMQPSQHNHMQNMQLQQFMKTATTGTQWSHSLPTNAGHAGNQLQMMIMQQQRAAIRRQADAAEAEEAEAAAQRRAQRRKHQLAMDSECMQQMWMFQAMQPQPSYRQYM
jgi:hypothetical protein